MGLPVFAPEGEEEKIILQQRASSRRRKHLDEYHKIGK
jgi:hypothetical protein